jgi:hypothetical protein
MSLPAPGNPISANMINVEANRTGSTYAPLSVNQIPVSTSLIGLYVDSGVNQAAPHKYSEFFSKTFVQPQSPYWFINTTNLKINAGGIGFKYYVNGFLTEQDPSAQIDITWNTIIGQGNNGSGLTINNNEKLVLGGSIIGTTAGGSETLPMLGSFDETTGIPEVHIAYDWTGTLTHWASDLHFIDGFDNKVFWVDQEIGTNDGGSSDKRRYGVVDTEVTLSPSSVYVPELWQWTGWVRAIEEADYRQGTYYTSPKIASVNFSQSVSPYDNTTKAYVYICNQIEERGASSDQEYNGSIVRMTYDSTTSTGTSVCLSSPLFKVYKANPGRAGAPWNSSDMTSFTDLCVIPYNGGGPF